MTARSAMLELTGTLTTETPGSFLPSGITKSYIVKNSTSGAFNAATILISRRYRNVVSPAGRFHDRHDRRDHGYSDAVDSTTALGRLGTASTLNFGTSVTDYDTSSGDRLPMLRYVASVSIGLIRYAPVAAETSITAAYDVCLGNYYV